MQQKEKSTIGDQKTLKKINIVILPGPGKKTCEYDKIGAVTCRCKLFPDDLQHRLQYIFYSLPAKGQLLRYFVNLKPLPAAHVVDRSTLWRQLANDLAYKFADLFQVSGLQGSNRLITGTYC